jgi:hypothetical protein
VVLAISLALTVACDDDDASRTAVDDGTAVTSAATSAARDDAAGALVGAHDCVVGDSAQVSVEWETLRNPVFATDQMTKDPTVRVLDGRWYLLFSERFDPQAPEGPRIRAVTSDDLTDWEPASDDAAVDEWGSPDLTRDEAGRYVLTFQQRELDDAEISRIHYSTGPGPAGPWDEPRPLVHGMFPDERAIDAALARTEWGTFVMFKRGLHDAIEQHAALAYSRSGSLDGPWEYLGEPDVGWTENFQFLVIDGVWHVLLTTIPIHTPTLFRLAGAPSEPQAWLHWEEVATFEVPQEDWNRGTTPGIDHETANSAYLCDARAADGYWYLFYAGSTELTTFEGRGHARIGVARSRDLRTWTVPPG